MAFIKNVRLTLDLSHNQIETFSLEATPEALFIYNTSSVYGLRLGGNPLRCDCYLSELRQKVAEELESVISDKIQLEDGDQLTCSSGRLAGRRLATVRYKELSCVTDTDTLKE
jgi:hypothetical protein